MIPIDNTIRELSDADADAASDYNNVTILNTKY
jgi:hypothetical protein